MRSVQTDPKPYDLVLFETSPERQRPRGHEQWQSKTFAGRLQCQLRVLSPVHIGSGLFELANGQVVRGFARTNDQFVIPGASLKGVFRSIAEAISASCVSKTRARTRDLPFRAMGECDNPKQLCVCCHLFGSLGYLGRVRFLDAQTVQQTLA